MINKFVALLSIALMTTAEVAVASPITYDLASSFSAGGSTLSGSIVVSDNGDGFVTGSEIVGWSFSSVGNVQFATISGSTMNCAPPSGCFSIVGNQLEFDFGSNSQISASVFDSGPTLPFVSFFANNGSGSLDWGFYPSGSGNPTLSIFNSSSKIAVGTEAAAAVVPEPGSLVLVAVALALCVGVSKNGHRARHPARD